VDRGSRRVWWHVGPCGPNHKQTASRKPKLQSCWLQNPHTPTDSPPAADRPPIGPLPVTSRSPLSTGGKAAARSKTREFNKKQIRAEVENSFLNRQQRAGSKAGEKKQRQKIYLEEIPGPTSRRGSTCAYMCVLTGEQGAGRCCLVGLLVACV
jgi:hypothetical protein